MAARSPQQCWVWVSVLSALLTAAPRGALAEPRELQDTQAPPEAMTHFERGREHFRGGRYREAIVELEAALALDPESPTLMYNLAYANELLGELEPAIVYYRKYLEALPPSAGEEREKIRVTLRRLEGHREQVKADPEPESAGAAAPDAVPADPEPQTLDSFGNADGWFWASLGGGVAMLGGATATGLMALDREESVAGFVVGQDGSIGERQELQDEADRLALTSDLLIGGGVALVTAATLLFLLRSPEDDEPQARAALACDGRTALVIVGADF